MIATGFFGNQAHIKLLLNPRKSNSGEPRRTNLVSNTRARGTQQVYSDEIIELADDSQKKFKTVTSMAVIDKLYGLMAKRLNRFHGQQDREETEIGMGLSYCSP